MIRATYTRDDIGQEIDLDIPLADGESFEDGLARIAPILRDALGIPPAPEIGSEAWKRIKDMARPRGR